MDAIVQKFDDPIPKNIDSIIISQSDDLNFVSTSIDRSSKSTKGTYKNKNTLFIYLTLI